MISGPIPVLFDVDWIRGNDNRAENIKHIDFKETNFKKLNGGQCSNQ